jgi:hypothetical protein
MSALILIASVLGLSFGVIYTLFKPRWAMVFILVLYPLEQLLTTASPFFSTNTKFLNIVVGGLAVLGAGSALFAGRRPLRGYFNALWWMTILLYLYSILGIAFAPEPESGIEHLIGAIPYLGLLLVFPALLVNDLEDFRRLLVPLMIVGATIIVLILLSPKTTMFGGRLGIENTAGGRDGPEILNPLATAGLGGTIVIFGMLYRPVHAAGFINLVRVGAIAIGLVIALLSGSRGQLLGALFCGIVMFPFARQVKNMVQFITVSASAGLGLVFVMLVINFATTRDAAERWSGAALTEGVGTRQQMMAVMLGEWINNPAALVQGLGTSSFDYYWTISDAPYVHNMPVQILTEHGLIGFAILSVIMFLGYRMSVTLLRIYRDDPRQLSTAAVLIAFCLYQFLLSLKQGNFFMTGAPFWCFLILSKIYARTMADLREQAALEAVGYEYDDYDEHESAQFA